MDPIQLNKILASIFKSREIQRNIVQERSLEQSGFFFFYFAEKLCAPMV